MPIGLGTSINLQPLGRVLLHTATSRTLQAILIDTKKDAYFVMSEGRGLTLRKKGTRKHQISAPKPISGPISKPNPSDASLQLPPPRDRLGQSETSDIVKRRYSTRYNQLPDFSAGAPPIPGLPGQLKRFSRGGSPTRPTTAGSGRAVRVNINALSDPNLQPDRCTELSRSNNPF